MGRKLLAEATPAATSTEGSHERALRKALDIAGGVRPLAAALGMLPAVIYPWVDSDGECPLAYCAAVEQATGVKCDELRSDVVWLRTDTEVIGYVMPTGGADIKYIDAHLKNTEEANSREIALAMADGVMICASDEVKAQLRAEYDLDNPAKVITLQTLHGLATDVEDATSDRDYHYAYGMMRGLSDEQKEEIKAKFQVFATYRAEPGEFEAIEAAVAVLRGGELDDEARSQYIMGIMHGLEDGPVVDRLIAKHGASNIKAWTPAKSDALWADVQRLLSDQAAGETGDEVPWIDDLMPWYSPFTGPFYSKVQLERKRQAADNLIENLNHGQVALLDYLWTAMVTDKMQFSVDGGSPASALNLSRIVAQLIQRTTDLRSQFEFALNPPEGATAVVA
jgi:DNA-binding transcriptional regulator YdaS (Cro superfamily)